MRLFAVAVVVLCSTGGALAAPKTVAVAVGDCRNAELLTGMATFHDALKARWHDEVYAPDVVLSLLRPRAALSLEDVQRQVESARTLYYAGQGARALDLARQATAELEKMSPQVKPWPTTAAAILLQGTSLRAIDAKNEWLEPFRRVLRVDPTFKLDPNLFTPSMQEAFEALRKEQTKARKSSLQVQSTPGAEVFIDGKSMGKAPLKVDLVPSTYRVSVAIGEQVSFPHVVTVPKEGSVQIDLAFEGALVPQTPLCLSTASTPAESLAQKLGNALGAEQVVIFWRENRDGPPFYRASILKTGVKDREGGVQAGLSNNKPVEELANFIVTGQGNGIVGAPGADPTPPIAPVVSAPPPLPAPQVVSTESGPTAASKIIGFSLVGVGVASAVVGIVVFALGEPDRTRFAMLTASGALPPTTSAGYQEALDLLPRVQETRVASFGLIGAGVGLAVSGALTVWLFRDQPLAAVSIAPTAHGASIGYSGSF